MIGNQCVKLIVAYPEPTLREEKRCAHAANCLLPDRLLTRGRDCRMHLHYDLTGEIDRMNRSREQPQEEACAPLKARR